MKGIIAFIILIFSFTFYSYAEELSKLSGTQDVEAIMYASSSTTWIPLKADNDGNLLVRDISGGAAAGTTTSYIFGYDGSQWFRIRVGTVNALSITYVNGDGYIRGQMLNYGMESGGTWYPLKVDTTGTQYIRSEIATNTLVGIYGYDGTNWTPIHMVNNALIVGGYDYGSPFATHSRIRVDSNGWQYSYVRAENGKRISIHELQGYSTISIEDDAATTTATIITAVTGQTLEIGGIIYFSRDTTNAGNIDFYSDSAGTNLIFPAYCTTEGAWGHNVFFSLADGGLYVTTPGAFAITVWYRQYTP